MIVKEFQQPVALFLLVSDDVASDCCISVSGSKAIEYLWPTLRVHINRLLACSLPLESVRMPRKSEVKGPTGCVRITGCTEVTGFLRTMLPRLLLF